MVGFFSRNRDDQDQEYLEEQPAMQPAPAPSPPSVDGVLPPGVSPTPAPVGNNLASQTTNPADQFHTKGASTSVHVAPAEEDSAGDYIMTAPPVEQRADEWSEPSAEPVPSAEHKTTPAYEETPQQHYETAEEHAPAVESVPQSENTPEEPAPVEEPYGEPSHPEQAAAVSPAVSVESDNSNPGSSEAHIEVTAESDSSDDLERIRQQALQQLTPLVEHLKQSPEEKFHTLMMLLQSTDDRSLIAPAYEAAQQIEDAETKAQALVDVVREINYLHQKSE